MDTVEAAARRTAINLMRLNEGLEMAEAREYPRTKPPSNEWTTRRTQRLSLLANFYKNWFNDVAGGSAMGQSRQRDMNNPTAETDPSEAR